MSARSARCALALVILATTSVVPTLAHADAPIYSFSVRPSSSQAGGHPDILTQFEVATTATEEPAPCRCNDPKEILIDTSQGLVGVPGNIPECTAADFAALSCPVDSQIGISAVRVLAPLLEGGAYSIQPVYNMVPGFDELARIATPGPRAQNIPIFTSITARTESDFGLEFRTFGIPKLVPPNEIDTILWGVPADPSHDLLRFPFQGIPLNFGGGESVRALTITCNRTYGSPVPDLFAARWPQACLPFGYTSPFEPTPVPANSAAQPFTVSPTSCGGALTATIEDTAYDFGTDYMEAPYEPATGCDQLGFNPSLTAKPTTTQADTPSGLNVDLNVPQTLSPSTPTASAIRDVNVTLPVGFTINPNAADGKLACSDAQARFGTREAAQCPEYSKIGTLGVTSASFPEELPGAIYLGEPLPGERYRLVLAFDGFSLHVKLPGTVAPDPQTGQLRVSFHDLPEFDFDDFKMHIFGSERGLLATPARCGNFPVVSTFTPWAYPDIPTQTSTQFFAIESGPEGTACPTTGRPFAPRFATAATNSTAGAHSPITVELARPDGDQNLTGFSVSFPPGFSASLRGVPYCPESAIGHLAASSYSGLAEQSSPACPVASQIGVVTASASAGTRPVYVPGRVYLAGPYKGAPLSALVIIPAVSGPYDLGNLAVRVALQVNRATAQVTAVSDPFPSILEGVPLRTRSLQVILDRREFALNPTNCDPLPVNALADGDEGATAQLYSHFQVADCAGLPFAPRLRLTLSGGRNRLGHPAVDALLATALGEVNLQRISVTLPPGELLDQSHIGTVCTKVDFAAHNCPPDATIGHAKVTSPLLDQPLEGSLYLRSSSQGLPDIAIDLGGQFEIEAVARVDTVNERYRVTFRNIPDVPLGTVSVHFDGGHRGLLQNSKSLCGKPRYASARFTAQDDARHDASVKLLNACAKKKSSRKAHRR